MDFREYRMVEEPPLALNPTNSSSAEVLDLCVRRFDRSEHCASVKEERSSPAPSTDEHLQYPLLKPTMVPYNTFHTASQAKPFLPDAIPFSTITRSSGSPGVIRPHPTMATPPVQYFSLQQPQQKQQSSLSILHQHLLQPNTPPPSAPSECHITLSSPSSHSPASSDSSSLLATSPAAAGVTQTSNPLSIGYMLQTPAAFPISPLPSQAINSSGKSNCGKSQRPFKSINISMSHSLLCSQDYLQFRQRMLEKIEKRITKRNNKNFLPKRATSPSQQPSSSDGNSQISGTDNGASTTAMVKDAAYRERRKKNNEAAKRSRDARREKEDELAIRTSFLEQENMILKCQVISLEKKLGIYPSANTLRWQL